MYEIDEKNKQIFVEIPLTMQSSKVRVKARSSFYEYGLPVATRQIPFAQKHYVEWQICYDIDKNNSKKLALTRLKNSEFFRAKDKDKKKPRALYELSEYLFYFAKLDIVSLDEIDFLSAFLKCVENKKEFISDKFEIHTQALQPLFQSYYLSMFSLRTINLPYLIWQNTNDLNCRFSIEVVIKAQQKAVGVQPMLYVCFPITQLQPTANKPALLGRVAEENEYAHLVLGRKDKNFVLEAFKIFGILSENHNYDIRQILWWIRANLNERGLKCLPNA